MNSLNMSNIIQLTRIHPHAIYFRSECQVPQEEERRFSVPCIRARMYIDILFVMADILLQGSMLNKIEITLPQLLKNKLIDDWENIVRGKSVCTIG